MKTPSRKLLSTSFLLMLLVLIALLLQNVVLRPISVRENLEKCLANAAEENERLVKDIFSVWAKGGISDSLRDLNQRKVDELYEERKKDCYNIYGG